MQKWIAKINEDDSEHGSEIRLGYEGTLEGFRIVSSDGSDPELEPAMTAEEARLIVEEEYGFYDTFEWIDAGD